MPETIPPVASANAAGGDGRRRAPAFDADPIEFRLAAEALRIQHAARYDPMAGVNSSNIDPLPHQIRAVYEELLPRIPLRFLLADDPGAGKTIMAGLYIKELILRSDCERAIIVAPGALVEQWRDELAEKFDLRFELFHRRMLTKAPNNPFVEHPFLIARMDQLARNPDLMELLAETTWDVAVVDEAHRMSAHYSSWVGEVDETRRFRLGRLLSQTAHNLLLMTATPHAGIEEDFQVFMSLLDRDRFEGQFRQGVHRTDTAGLMRRMVKEDLLTFDGKPLFPERRAYTVEYELGPAERELYERVTNYVRTEMGRAERIANAGDKKRGNNVGFALTMLQRRLASSTEAILCSLERRSERLSAKLTELEQLADDALGASASLRTSTVQFDMYPELPSLTLAGYDDMDGDVTDDERADFEAAAEEVIDLATAAQTMPELRAEIATLGELVGVAKRVRAQDADTKWGQLRTILDEQLLTHGDSGDIRKLIVFTEHRDTLNYLQRKITTQFGRENAVITIHGAMNRDERKQAREQFTHNPETVVLLATDAAGEGLNLQRAHLMVNYDLPWNPNRIEQRFGRIHRIGQREVCHLWNLVARDTREGDVFATLLHKIEQISRTFNGNLFNVLGSAGAFHERPLRALLIEAIRYGDRAEVRERLRAVIDGGVDNGVDEMLRERALHPEMFSSLDLDEVRARMEQARERKLQPGYIAGFFLPAFKRLGGQVFAREKGRYEIARVPSRVLNHARQQAGWLRVTERYERITFEPARARPEGLAEAALIAPGDPLLAAVIAVTLEDLGDALHRGAVFVDPRPEQADAPILLFSVEQRIENAAGDTVSHHFDYPLLAEDGTIIVSAAPPYLDFDPPPSAELGQLAEFTASEWAQDGHELQVREWAAHTGLEPRLAELAARLKAETERTRAQVRERLRAEINHWDGEYNRLEVLERAGVTGRLRAVAARERADALAKRLKRRLAELDAATELHPLPPVVRSAALVVPSALLAPAQGPSMFARDTKASERRSVDAVLAAERKLGRTAVEMAHNNPGYDIVSTDANGFRYFIEVKGRVEGADTFTITANEISFAQSQEGRHRLALVAVSADGPEHDRLRYVGNAFSHLDPSSTTRSLNEVWADYWSRGGPPH